MVTNGLDTIRLSPAPDEATGLWALLPCLRPTRQEGPEAPMGGSAPTPPNRRGQSLQRCGYLPSNSVKWVLSTPFYRGKPRLREIK